MTARSEPSWYTSCTSQRSPRCAEESFSESSRRWWQSSTLLRTPLRPFVTFQVGGRKYLRFEKQPKPFQASTSGMGLPCAPQWRQWSHGWSSSTWGSLTTSWSETQGDHHPTTTSMTLISSTHPQPVLVFHPSNNHLNSTQLIWPVWSLPCAHYNRNGCS